MLVVTANWAFTDGTLVSTTTVARAARAWLRSVRLATVRAGFGRDGRYRPVDGLDIVLAGDTCDGLVSSEWTGRIRPWHEGARVRETRDRVLSGSARRAAPLLAGLARLVRSGMSVPGADRRGRPTMDTSVRVPVRTALLPGDRDRHLADVTAAVVARGGIVTPAWSDETALVVHGHEFDPACHAAVAAGSARAPSLAESVAVELVVPFVAALARLDVPRAWRIPLGAAVSNAEPVHLPAVVAAWCSPHDAAGPPDAAPLGAVREAWCRAVDAWLRTARRDPPECGLPASPLEALAAWFTAAESGHAPSALEWLFAAGRPPHGGLPVGSQTLVFGHLPASAAAGICLGRPPVRRCRPVTVLQGSTATAVACVAARPPSAPATVVWRGDGGPPAWLADEDAAAEVGGAGCGHVVDAA